jgi:hypothetical protein
MTARTDRGEEAMVRKTPLGGGKVEVAFTMPPMEGVAELHVCGDFNGWDTAGAPLAQGADGSWTTTLVLEAGKSYRYRYCDGQGSWHNDWAADAYVPNSFGSEDSVLVLEANAGDAAPPAAGPAAKKPSARKPPARKPASGGQPEKKPSAAKPAVKPAAKRGAKG